jgi:hypothetical protein
MLTTELLAGACGPVRRPDVNPWLLIVGKTKNIVYVKIQNIREAVYISETWIAIRYLKSV